VASVFVNPKQFAPHEDFDSYPRGEARDAELLAGSAAT
jgi:pantoate--beta-alanine ligase